MEINSKILIVDDKEGVREVLRHKLESLGCRIDDVSSAREALLMIKDNKYDFVVTDLDMPEMDGMELLQQLRKSDDFSGKIIIATGDTFGKQLSEADGVFEKPFSKEAIYQTIKDLLDRDL